MTGQERRLITVELSEADLDAIEDAFFAENDDAWLQEHRGQLVSIWERLCHAMDRGKETSDAGRSAGNHR